MRHTQSSNLSNTFYDDEFMETIPPCNPNKIYRTLLYNMVSPVQHYKLEEPISPPLNEGNDIKEENSDEVLVSDRIYMVLDGSMNPVSGRAAFHWILTTESREREISCSKPMQANAAYMPYFRTEMA